MVGETTMLVCLHEGQRRLRRAFGEGEAQPIPQLASKGAAPHFEDYTSFQVTQTSQHM